MTVYRNFSEIPPLKYGLIMADPPWSFQTYSAKGQAKGPDAHYACRDAGWIKSLPVGHLAARDCVLWLWATNPMLPDAIATLEAWGFTFKTAGHWVKRTRHGKHAFGTGYILRSAGEPFLIGTLGAPRTARNVRGVIDAPVREHSRKPQEAFDAAERLFPNVHRLELFGREERPGWDVMGDQVGVFA